MCDNKQAACTLENVTVLLTVEILNFSSCLYHPLTQFLATGS